MCPRTKTEMIKEIACTSASPPMLTQLCHTPFENFHVRHLVDYPTSIGYSAKCVDLMC